METQNSMKYFVAGIALFLVGAVVGVFADPYLPAALSNSQRSYQSGFDAAKTLVENSSLGVLLGTTSDVRSLAGTVISVDGNKLTLHVKSTNPFDDPALADRTVIVDTSTTVVKLIPRDLKVYQAEVDSYLKTQGTATSTGATKPTTALPSAFTQTPASAADIGTGDSIRVLTSENVKTLKEFVASGIQIQSKGSATRTP